MNRIQFKILDTTYKCKNISELTLDKYNLLFGILSEQNDEINQIKKILNILADIPIDTLDNIDVISFTQIDFKSILNQEIKSKPIQKSYKIKGTEYITQNLNKIKFGRYVDADFFLTSKDNSKTKIQNVVACLLLPDNYNIEDVNDLSNKLSKFKVETLLSIFNHFSEYRIGIIKSYPNLFIGEPEEDEDAVSLYDKSNNDNPLNEPSEDEEDTDEEDNINGWGWQGIIYSLTNDDITKVDEITNKKLIEVLEFLSYRKFQSDEQIKQINKK